jgi:NAD-dependent DNA ligase
MILFFVEKEEIIPKIIAVDLSKPWVNAQPTKYITELECQTELVREVKAETIIVPTFMLSTADYRRIQHFISRKAMDIEGWRRNGSFAFLIMDCVLWFIWIDSKSNSSLETKQKSAENW